MESDKSVLISAPYKQLLDYMVAYLDTRQRTTIKSLLQRLILLEAKRLTTGMPEKRWRNNMLALILEAEKNA